MTVLTRKGVQFGNNAAVVVDDLQYAYEDFSNKIKSVTDVTKVASTATVDDFKDGNKSGSDYVYDDNGNLVVDLNKNIKNLVGANGVTYNHLDKPVEIKIEGKGTVKITYDADGAKLKGEFLNSTTNATKVTWYLGEYQYEEVVGGASPKAFAVEFISFGEGRIRPITPRNESNTYDALQLDGNLTLPNGKKGSIDYFISDHRTDVRMILTEEKQWSYTTASMETASSRNTVEEGLFSTQVNLSRAPKTEVPGWTANTSQYVSKLNNTRMVGPNQMLKVMAGDLLHANVQYYYQQVATNSTGSTVFGSVLSMLGSSITGSAVTSAATKAASSSIIANLNTGLPFSQVISPDITSSTGNLPKAYLNVVFFDERFNFVSESSTSVRVGAANVAANLALTQIKAPENGYCYVYISNESTVSVYFDNLQVRHDRGRIIEENHYYAYGLRINAISSKAYGGPANNYLYQGDFAELDEDLGWTDFMLRSYDAEIGRFLQNDPYDEFASGYLAMGGDPANLIDPTGGSTLPEVIVTATIKAAPVGRSLNVALQVTSTVVAINSQILSTFGTKSPDDFVIDNSTGKIRWDKNANSQATTQSGETYLGKNLKFKFISYIDEKLWDGPLGSFPAGEKIVSIIEVNVIEDIYGNLLSVDVKSSSDIKLTGGFIPTRDYFPGLGADQNKTINIRGVKNFSEIFEQHGSVNALEAAGLGLMGYDVVNVAQRLTLSLQGNSLSVQAATDVFPSASLSVNGNLLFRYYQPSFKMTHGRNSSYEDNGMGGVITKDVPRRLPPAFYIRFTNY